METLKIKTHTLEAKVSTLETRNKEAEELIKILRDNFIPTDSGLGAGLSGFNKF